MKNSRGIFLIVMACMPLVVYASDYFPSDSNSVRISGDTVRINNEPLRTTIPDILPHIPTSPQAEAFQRVGSYTINNSSGMPDISIPLYEIDHCGYKIPLVLRYVATPLRQGYNYDVCGRGWGLTVNSCISRSIESMPDEQCSFKLGSGIFSHFYSQHNNNYDGYDFQHDIFNVTLPDGRSFSFCICDDDGNRKYLVSDKRPWKITCQQTTGITGFILTDDKGVKYFFTVMDNALLHTSSYRVAWYLSRIELPNTATPITFSYGKSIMQENQNISNKVLRLKRYFNCYGNYSQQLPVGVSLDEGTPGASYQMKLLTTIHYGPTYINFTYQNTDDDIPYNYLSNISVYDGQSLCRSYNLTYIIRDQSGHQFGDLTRLAISGSDQQAPPLVYQFTYSGYSSMSGSDHWGYRSYDTSTNTANFNIFVDFNSMYNSPVLQSNLFSLLTKTSQEPHNYQKFKIQSSSSDTRWGTPASNHDYLSSITYPNGGRTTFEFETHRFVTSTNAQGDNVVIKRQRRVVQGGGMRIKKIRNYTADGVLADAKSYFYGPTYYEVNLQGLNYPQCSGNNSRNHIGFGEPVVDPCLRTYLKFYNSYRIPSSVLNMLYGVNSQGQVELYGNPFSLADDYNWQWECQFSALNFRRLVDGRNAVVYPEITEYYGDVDNLDASNLPVTGKTVYRYSIYDYGDSVYLEPLRFYGHTVSYQDNPPKRDWLTKKQVYGYNYGGFNLLNEETYSYNFSNSYIHGYIYKDEFVNGAPDIPSYYTVGQCFESKTSTLGKSLLSGVTEKEHTPSGTLTRSRSYSYNTKDQLTSMSYTGRETKTVTYTYPDDSQTAPAIEQEMVARNMMSMVIESKERYQLDISGYKLDYASYTVGGTTLLLPSRIYSLNVTSSSSAFEEEHQVLSYTANGNPVEVVDRAGVHTVYLWSYNDRYLVAEVKNATLSQVNAALSTLFGTDATGLAALASPSETSLRNLCQSSLLAGAMVIAWTYRPLAGITSETDASGITTYYDYDGLGRLREVYRYAGNTVSPANKQVLNQYSYHTTTN